MSNLDDVSAAIARLEALEAIKNTKHAYFRCMTLGERDELRDLLTEDVKTSYSDGKYVFDNRQALLDFLIESHDPEAGVVAYWMAGMPELELVSDTTARGKWAMYHNYFNSRDGFINEMFVYYEDEYRLEDGKWKISVTGYQAVIDKITLRKKNPFSVMKPAWVDAEKNASGES